MIAPTMSPMNSSSARYQGATNRIQENTRIWARKQRLKLLLGQNTSKVHPTTRNVYEITVVLKSTIGIINSSMVVPTGNPKIRLDLLILLALLARIPAVLFSSGYEFFDEQFQYVDPAWHLADGGPFFETEDWQLGIRSWVYPSLLSVLFKLALSIGVETPEGQLIITRAVLAVFSLVALIGFHGLLVNKLRYDKANLVLIALAINPILIYQSVHPNGPAFSCVLVLFALSSFLHGGTLRSTLAGIALGLGFCCRPQDGLYLLPLILAGIYQRRHRELGWFLAGAALMILIQGLVDLHTYGSFLRSPLEYVRYNLENNRNAEWGEEPWFYYLVALLIVTPLAPVGLRWLWRGAGILPWIAGSAFFSIFVHQLITHKSARFVTPALVIVSLLWVIGAMEEADSRAVLVKISKKLGVALWGVGFMLASFAYPNQERVEAALLLSELDPGNGTVYYDLTQVDFGGYFYYRALAPRISCDAKELAEVLDSSSPPDYLVARASAEIELPDSWQLLRLERFCPMMYWRTSRCMHVYQLLRTQTVTFLPEQSG